ncbi:TetR/AcrR family transcriptional regulator [Amycolatopsis keratiniphila]|uniref:TetR family transcriptional regulator n=1 Tax=Amycolatopsis keratiniphila subsp. keratiniphila TaxID=227715 RepID=A0A1W2LY83_9PSEU|nr:TetR/AcrR family transcriptional regulator [Amycolatopsis keratiniphila]OLZ58118.1 TetR family transcriptional regulator [Amycolatopsis keratiniphila subsp. nogabecina]ONF72176.1 TetR family transcriptional regulator [Amycolatopsis keratiniphila subsp. keratiniphila]SDU44227.1 DNA-binding transcriptional regulator, AcrR family [Amycolatopsis keratiniphila]
MSDVKHFDPDAVLDSAVRLFWRQGVDSTGVQEIVTATGVNRSSLYATFGGKRDLYVESLRRYVSQRSEPVMRRLAEDARGLPAISDFFAGLISARCSGEYARWGCMISNAHANGGNDDPDVREVLQLHHDQLRAAMRAAVENAAATGQMRRGVSAAAAADMLALLAYGVNLRSRAGAEPDTLTETVSATISLLAA